MNGIFLSTAYVIGLHFKSQSNVILGCRKYLYLQYSDKKNIRGRLANVANIE